MAVNGDLTPFEAELVEQTQLITCDWRWANGVTRRGRSSRFVVLIVAGVCSGLPQGVRENCVVPHCQADFQVNNAFLSQRVAAHS